MRALAALFVCVGLLCGQEFEVASVKLSLPPDATHDGKRELHGGPGSTDPGSINLVNIDLYSLMTLAYDINRYQLVAPDWTQSAKFDIVAKLPPETTRPQYRAMLQKLLAERFKLAVHREQKDGQGFEMTVAKGGPHLTKPSDDPAAAFGDGSLQPAIAAPQAPPRTNGWVSVRFVKSTMDHLADRLAGLLNQPVHNATGIEGEYAFRIEYSMAGLTPDTAGAPDVPATILDALPEQLGLKLAPKKTTYELVVVDHIEKVPVEN